MTPREFDKVVRELFLETLSPLGFSCERSKNCTFYRDVGGGIWHVIMPDLGTRGIWYDVKVFPCSDSLEPRFQQRFPDELGIPTDSFCYLSERGVGMDQAQFNCKTEKSLRTKYRNTVASLLQTIAVPFLDQFSTLRNVLPVIRNPLYRAIALHLLNRDVESLRLVNQQRLRLEAIPDDENVIATKQLLDSLVAS